MEMKEAKRRVALFKIADGSDSDAVSDILARLLVAGSLCVFVIEDKKRTA